MKKRIIPINVPELIKKLKETAKCGKPIMGCYTIKIHQNYIGALIEDLVHTNGAAEIYWSMRKSL